MALCRPFSEANRLNPWYYFQFPGLNAFLLNIQNIYFLTDRSGPIFLKYIVDIDVFNAKLPIFGIAYYL